MNSQGCWFVAFGAQVAASRQVSMTDLGGTLARKALIVRLVLMAAINARRRDSG